MEHLEIELNEQQLKYQVQTLTESSVNVQRKNLGDWKKRVSKKGIVLATS